MNNNELNSMIPAERIERTIYSIRGRRIILDQDLAALYGVQTKNLNKAVHRNQKRFPPDFIFQLTADEWLNLKFQFGTSSSGWRGKRKLPFAFTEHGVAMASNLLKSKRAVEVSVEIVRTFIRIREQGLDQSCRLIHDYLKLGKATNINTIAEALYSRTTVPRFSVVHIPKYFGAGYKPAPALNGFDLGL